MTREAFEFQSSDGRSTIRGELWLPLGVSRGLVQFVHGMNDYGGRYETLFHHLNKYGYAAAYHDHLGHGITARSEDELGFFAEHHGDRLLIADVTLCYQLLASRFPALPHFLMGHSMGSYIVRIVLAQQIVFPTGAIIMGTGGKNNAALPGSWLASLISLLKGKHYRTELINNMAFKSYTPKDGAATCMSAWLNRDGREVAKFLADEKCNHTFTAAGFRDLFKLAYLSNKEKIIAAMPCDLPLLILSGGQDALGRNGEDIQKLAKHWRELGQKDLTVHIYTGARHELCMETNRQEVYDDLTDWLDKYC